MTNVERSPNDEMPETLQSAIFVESAPHSFRALKFVIISTLVIRHSSFTTKPVCKAALSDSGGIKKKVVFQ